MLLNCGAGEGFWESLGSNEIKTVNPKGNQPWIYIRRTDAEAEAPILWPPDEKRRLIGKDPDCTGKDWGQEEKGVTEDEIAGWHHRLNWLEFELSPGASEGQGSLARCSPWGCKELDMTKQLKKKHHYIWRHEIFDLVYFNHNIAISQLWKKNF